MRAVAIVGALLLAACNGERSAQREEAVPQADAPIETPAGFVVVGASVPLHRVPSADTPYFAFDPGIPGDAFRSFEVVGHEAEWIRIRNVRDAAAAKHCIRGWEALDHFALEFWVRKADLHDVTRRTVLAKFGDGTSAMVAAGAPIEPAGALWRALGPGAGAELPMQWDAVGKFYTPSSLPQLGKTTDVLLRDTGLEVGGHTVPTPALLGGEEIDVFARESRDDGTLVTVGSRCAELKAMVRGKAPFDPSATADPEAEAIAEAEAALEALDATADRYGFEPGAEVFWRDGEKAGALVAGHTFARAPEIDSDRRCFRHAGLDLCLRADDMTLVRTGGGS